MLIADDDPSVVKLLVDQCTGMGFDVETASNGLHVLLKARQNTPYTLILDVNMPEIDGLSVCAHLLKPDRTPVNVIVITGSKDPDIPERCKAFGAYYVRKGPSFWFDLEAALMKIHPRMADQIRRSNEHAPAVRPRPCVLLIDDDNDINLFLSSRLAKLGLELKYANDAQLGFRMACSEEPAVVVTDYFMPNGGAEYLLARLRSTSTTETIPVVVFSGRALDEVTVQILKRDIGGHPGAAQVLKKSHDADALFQTLKTYCGFERNHRRMAIPLGQQS
ncbi:MAG: response regulator [Bradyrhizobium sp.]|nr:MAG: response regulator [Bradyrhizobium sp.]